MKKVRLAIGAAVPALGIVAMPTAHAATLTPRTPTAHLQPAANFHLMGHGKTPGTLVDCPLFSNRTAHSTHLHLVGSIIFSDSCVAIQQAFLDKRQTGLTERVRFYDKDGERTLQRFNAGFFDGKKTVWNSTPETYAANVCQAIVYNGTSNIAYGPVCERTNPD